MDANTNPQTRFAVRNVVNQTWSDLARDVTRWLIRHLVYRREWLLTEEHAEPVLEQDGAIRVMPVT